MGEAGGGKRVASLIGSLWLIGSLIGSLIGALMGALCVAHTLSVALSRETLRGYDI